MPGRNMVSHSANSAWGRMRDISSASVSAGDRQSSPDGSQSAGYMVSALNQPIARAAIASRSAGSPAAARASANGQASDKPNALPRRVP